MLIFQPSLSKDSSNPGPPQFSISDDDVLTKPLLECGLDSLPPEDHTGELTLLGDGSDAESRPVSERGVCFDMAILHNAYLLSEVMWLITTLIMLKMIVFCYLGKNSAKEILIINTYHNDEGLFIIQQ